MADPRGHTPQPYYRKDQAFAVQNRVRRTVSSNNRRVLTVERLNRLNAEARTREAMSASKLDTLIELHVDGYLASLDKRTRQQLSKTQMIKSHHKTHEWKVDNARYTVPLSKPVSREYLDSDLDPALYFEAQFTSNSSTSPSSSYYHVSDLRLDLANEKVLTGEEFEANILGTIKSDPTDSLRRVSKMQEWLANRTIRVQERDRLRSWIELWQKKEDLTAKELIKIYQKRRREYSYSQWVQIYEMEDNQNLSISQLLEMYRQEVPVMTEKPEPTQRLPL